MTSGLEPLTSIVTTDISAITRGRSVIAAKLEKTAVSGIGWVPANISLTPFGGIAEPNPWGSAGDLRILPDLEARFWTPHTGEATPFDMVCGNITELDGTPWPCCTRTMLIDAVARLKRETGLSVIAAFEQEFQLLGADMVKAHPMAMAALRRTGSFAPQVIAALEDAGVEPEMMLAEYGPDQFEITHAPASALTAADRAIAIREITREIARNRGFHTTFSPKTSPDGVGNGVHIHFSLVDETGEPVFYDPAKAGGLSDLAGAFSAGILTHLPAITAFTAASQPSYYRLKPHHWSAAYTWLGDRDRESTLRICPLVTAGGKDPSRQYNIEYRAADATANPYLSLAAIIHAGIEGILQKLPPPPLFSGDPELLDETERQQLGLKRLPRTLGDALAALEADPVVTSWFAPIFIETYLGEKRAELKALLGLDEKAICDRYRMIF